MRSLLVGCAALLCAAVVVVGAGPAFSAPSGSVRWCIGKDTSGAFRQVVNLYNKANPDVTVRLLELPPSADAQRSQLVQRQQAKSTECDVLGLDVIWTAEFAAQGWLKDVSSALRKRQRLFIPSTLSTVRYNGKLWAVPFNTNAGFLYYDTSKVKSAPKTWQQVYAMARQGDRLGFQGSRYEGLTVNFLEMLFGAGGTVLSPDGKRATINSPKAQQVLALMQKGVKDGGTPRAVLTYTEEESRNAFQTGKVALLRNWPYVYSLAKKAKVAFDLEPLPAWQGGKAASVLGGYNLAISAYSKNPAAAQNFIDFATGPSAQEKFFVQSSLPAVLTQTYLDRTVRARVPFAAELLKAVQQGRPRPVSPVYPQISRAIYDNVYSALSRGTAPKTALGRAQSQIDKALKTF